MELFLKIDIHRGPYSGSAYETSDVLMLLGIR